MYICCYLTMYNYIFHSVFVWFAFNAPKMEMFFSVHVGAYFESGINEYSTVACIFSSNALQVSSHNYVETVFYVKNCTLFRSTMQ